MDYIELVRESIDYIEDNLFEKISHSNVAEKLFISAFHFWRIFYAVTNYSVKEYVEKRRLSHILDQIEHTDSKLIDIAFDCGYNSPEVFSRVFKRNYGITPKQFRGNPSPFDRFERIDLVKRDFINVKSSLLVDYEIIHSENQKIYGQRIKITERPFNEDKVRQMKMDFAMTYLPQNPDLTYYIIRLDPSDDSVLAEYFLGFNGLENNEEFEEFVITTNKCISIDYTRTFSLVNDVTDGTISNDIYQVIANKDYTIDDTYIKMIELYHMDYTETGKFEMRIPIK